MNVERMNELFRTAKTKKRTGGYFFGKKAFKEIKELLKEIIEWTNGEVYKKREGLYQMDIHESVRIMLIITEEKRQIECEAEIKTDVPFFADRATAITWKQFINEIENY